MLLAMGDFVAGAPEAGVGPAAAGLALAAPADAEPLAAADVLAAVLAGALAAGLALLGAAAGLELAGAAVPPPHAASISIRPAAAPGLSSFFIQKLLCFVRHPDRRAKGLPDCQEMLRWPLSMTG